MPIYKYHCNKCNSYVEKIISFKESEGQHFCDKCKTRLVKIPTAAVFNVKGYNSTNGYSMPRYKK